MLRKLYFDGGCVQIWKTVWRGGWNTDKQWGAQLESDSGCFSGKTDRPGKNFLCWLIAVVLVLDTLIAGSVWQGLSVLRERSLVYAEQDTRNLASAVDASLTHSIESLDVSLRTLVNAIHNELANGSLRKERLTGLLEEQQQINHAGRTWAVIDANGNSVLQRGTDFPKNVSACAYFMKARQLNRDGLVMSGLLRDGSSGGSGVVFARPYHSASGDFAGVVAVLVPQTFFEQSIKRFTVRQHGLIAIRTAGLTLLARHGDSKGLAGRLSGAAEEISEEFYARLRAGYVEGSGFIKRSAFGVPGSYSFRYLKVAPLLVVSGVASDDYLEEWYRARHVALIYLGLLWVLSALIAYILYRSWLRQYRYAVELKEANEQLRVGNDVMRALLQVGEQGLCSVDFKSGRWDCSPEQLTIFGIDERFPRSAEGWKGLIHEEDRQQCNDYMRRIFRTHAGSIDTEYRIVRPSDGQIRWIHVIGEVEYLPDGSAERMFGAVRDITALRESQKRIKHLALHDELTGLPNRVLLSSKIQIAQAQALRNKDLLAICYLDMDRFQAVNDQHGHEVGDLVLREMARRLQSCLRAADVVARLGGDEFVILLGSLGEESELGGSLKRLQQVVEKPVQIGEVRLSLTSSIGVTLFPNDSAVEADVLLRHADNAMYEAKRSGKNNIRMFDPESDRFMRERQTQLARIKDAFRDREFVLYYQPKVDLHSEQIIGVEALIRWLDPQRGVLSPGSFLPVIEHTDFAIELGEWVIREAMQQKRIWQSEGIDLAVSVNVFALHLQQENFVPRLAGIMAEFPDVNPGGLELEILETSLITDLREVSRRILDGVALGVSFSIDDFGTGYASLSYFRRFPVETVKIDQSFVRDIQISSEDQALVRSIVDMAHSLGREVVAEGVETLDHGIFLILCGCDFAQGYGIARPMPAAEIGAWVAGWKYPEVWEKCRTVRHRQPVSKRVAESS